MQQQTKVYVTSKRRHAAMLLSRLRAEEGIHVTSRWMVEATLSKDDRPAPHWMQENFDDIVASHVVWAFAELGDALRLSIGEIYYALAHGKPIIAIGQWVENADGSGAPGTVYHPAYADWTSFPGVRRVGNLAQAIAETRAMVAASGNKLDTLSAEVRALTTAVHQLKEKITPSPSKGEPYIMIINVVDLETTGFEPQGGGVCEIAVVQFPSMEYFQSLINPGFPIGFDAMGTHHITNEMVASCQSLETAIMKALRWQDVDIWAAHNAEFDRSFLPVLAHRQWICTWRVAMHLWPDAPSHKNQALRYWLNLDVSDMPESAGLSAHRALYDAWVTAKLLQRELDAVKVLLRSEKILEEDAPTLESFTVDELVRLSNAPVILRKVRFGKHKDKLWADVDRGYLKWILGHGDQMDKDVIHTCKHHLGMLL